MNIIKIFVMLVVLLISVLPNASAQEQSPPLSTIAKSVSERMPGWKLERWRWMNNEGIDDKSLIYDWVAGGEKVRSVVELLPSPEEAVELFKVRPRGWSTERSDGRILEESPTGIGDDSRLIEYKSSGRKALVFRKGRIIVSVSASSRELAELFAVHIADAIPAD